MAQHPQNNVLGMGLALSKTVLEALCSYFAMNIYYWFLKTGEWTCAGLFCLLSREKRMHVAALIFVTF